MALMADGLGQPLYDSMHQNPTSECRGMQLDVFPELGERWKQKDLKNVQYKDVGRSSCGFCLKLCQTEAPRLGIRLRVFDGGGAREVASWATQPCRGLSFGVPSFRRSVVPLHRGMAVTKSLIFGMDAERQLHRIKS